MENILVIKHGALGDFILATGPMKSIRAHHKYARITLLTTKPYENFGKASGFFDEVWVDEKPRPWDIPGILKLRNKLLSSHFTRVYDLQTSTRSSAYFYLFPAAAKPEWCGIVKAAAFYHSNPARTKMHTLDRQKDQLTLAGIAEVFPPDISWLKGDISCFSHKQHYALLVPGGSPHRPEKRWHTQGFIDVAEWLSAQDIQPLLIGTKHEEEILRSIQAFCPEALNLCGQTSFGDIAELARHAKLAIGNDTGPMHIIAATGCPSLILFSRFSNPDLCAPRGEKVDIMRVDNLAALSSPAITDIAKRMITDA